MVLVIGCWFAPAGSARAASDNPTVRVLSAGPLGVSPAASATVPPGVQTGPDGVTLLDQSPWVERGHAFHLQLQIRARDPSHEYVALQEFNALVTRTGFDQALTGDIGAYTTYPPITVALSQLPVDALGGVDIDIPVNPTISSTSPLGIAAFDPPNGSAVFPLQIGLYRDGSKTLEGAQLTTFLVYAAGPQSSTSYPPLSVALIVPVHAAPVVNPDGTVGILGSPQSEELAALVDTLSAYPSVKLSLQVTPQTLDSLSAGSPLDQSTLSTLTTLGRRGVDQVLPSAYVSIPFVGWPPRLQTELTRQLRAGSSTLGNVFGTTPSTRTWVVNGPVDHATLQTLIDQGASQLIVPDEVLSALPAPLVKNTFAYPAELLDTGPSPVSVYGADVGLTADFSNSGGAVLAANQLLAELAMIQLETPGDLRGVAVLPPPGWSANPAFVATLLAGLAAHPLLSPVTASGLFAAVQVQQAQRAQRSLVSAQSLTTLPPSTAAAGPVVAPPSSTGSSSPASTVPAAEVAAAASRSAVDAAAQLAAAASTILSARSSLAGLGLVLPQYARQVGKSDQALLTAESSDITAEARQSLLKAASAIFAKATSQITLPAAAPITLTSTKGEIPLTVLAPPSLHARVQLRLSSPRLIFQLFSPPNGRCQVITSTNEVCDLTLTTRNTTLKVPVETRASGVFPLTVSLWTPDGSTELRSAHDTVRSTAVSGVGVVIIILAIVSLAIWWVRDLRHGRRARQLMPAPGDDGEECGDGALVVPEEELLEKPSVVNDPEDYDPVRDFFSTPAPDYDQGRSRRRP